MIEWLELEPRFKALAVRPLTAENFTEWLEEWMGLYDLIGETRQRLAIAHDQNTANREAEQQYRYFMEQILAQVRVFDQPLKEKLLGCGIELPELVIPLRNLRAEAGLYRAENVPLLTEEQKLKTAYNKLMAVAVHRLENRTAINEIWRQLMGIRQQIALNADFADYRAYSWQQRLRFDYTPDDCFALHQAIGEVVTPVIDSLRPWELEATLVAPLPAEPTFAKISTIFHRIDRRFGAYFDLMLNENLLDLEAREHKAAGSYMAILAVSKRPFIFASKPDLWLLFHEAGHAFHAFERLKLPYGLQRRVASEFNEVAATTMELLAWSHLDRLYGEEEAHRLQADYLKDLLIGFAKVAVVDSFQQWAYTHPDEAQIPENCDKYWKALSLRYLPMVDWTGVEDVLETGWQRVLHLFVAPFYYIEYAIARLGALQIWANALKDHAKAITHYHAALALGGTASLPKLYETARIEFRFDKAMLKDLIYLIKRLSDQKHQ